MKVTLESTQDFRRMGNKRFRVWEGESEGGVKVRAFIAAVQPMNATPEQLEVFEREFARFRLTPATAEL